MHAGCRLAGLQEPRSVEDFVARENIRRFKTQLAACQDDQQRLTLVKLLKAEEVRLHALRSAEPDSSRP